MRGAWLRAWSAAAMAACWWFCGPGRPERRTWPRRGASQGGGDSSLQSKLQDWRSSRAGVDAATTCTCIPSNGGEPARLGTAMPRRRASSRRSGSRLDGCKGRPAAREKKGRVKRATAAASSVASRAVELEHQQRQLVASTLLGGHQRLATASTGQRSSESQGEGEQGKKRRTSGEREGERERQKQKRKQQRNRGPRPDGGTRYEAAHERRARRESARVPSRFDDGDTDEPSPSSSPSSFVSAGFNSARALPAGPPPWPHMRRPAAP